MHAAGCSHSPTSPTRPPTWTAQRRGKGTAAACPPRQPASPRASSCLCAGEQGSSSSKVDAQCRPRWTRSDRSACLAICSALLHHATSPVPGGPKNSRLHWGRRMPVNSCGKRIGSSTASRSSWRKQGGGTGEMGAGRQGWCESCKESAKINLVNASLWVCGCWAELSRPAGSKKPLPPC